MMGPTGGSSSSAMNLLDVLSDPEKYKKALQDFAKVEAEATKKEEEASQTLINAKAAANKIVADAHTEASKITTDASDEAKAILSKAQDDANILTSRAQAKLDEANKRLNDVAQRQFKLDSDLQSYFLDKASLDAEKKQVDAEKTEIERKKAILSQL